MCVFGGILGSALALAHVFLVLRCNMLLTVASWDKEIDSYCLFPSMYVRITTTHKTRRF